MFYRKIKPVISTAELDSELNNIIVIDVRTGEEYRQGHIPGAVNIQFKDWAVTRGKLDVELPGDDVLSGLISKAGVDIGSSAVIVNNAESVYSLADACRVADTLIYAGILNTAVLDGGYDKWKTEDRDVSTDEAVPKITDYKATGNKNIFVKMRYVKGNIGKAILIDGRDADVYSGAKIENFAPKPGHIISAKSMPASEIWTSEKVFKTRDELAQITENVIGKDSGREIIIYCGVGGFTSAWWFVLTQILEYKNVKFYDGSMQDWQLIPENTVEESV
ncbi:MAG: sulfurtransferase [Spirochaetes bacterium]|nr:sulfurtransferase [Spirochaetota bacterium]